MFVINGAFLRVTLWTNGEQKSFLATKPILSKGSMNVLLGVESDFKYYRDQQLIFDILSKQENFANIVCAEDQNWLFYSQLSFKGKIVFIATPTGKKIIFSLIDQYLLNNCILQFLLAPATIANIDESAFLSSTV